VSTDLAAFKERQRQLWSAGDYSVTARRFEGVARELAAACGVGPGMRALDVAAGTGNGALAIAATGASAEACDLTPALVTIGRARCAEHGESDIAWEIADAEDLPYADGRFDAVLSVFGMVFAPRPAVAIAEAFRVTRSRGCVAFTAWTPGSAAMRFGEIADKYFPRMQDAPPPPHAWGDEQTCRARLAPFAADVRFELDSVLWSWPSAAAAREEMEECNNFVAFARTALPEARYMAFLDEGDDLMRSMNTATDGGLAYEAEYARIVARKTG
jgi:SAM-dependent methyltransferase